MASLGSKNKKGDGEEEEEDDAPVDRETVEKNLIHMMQVMDDKHHGSLLPEAVTTAVNNCAESCKLSETEVRGLIGEITPEGGHDGGQQLRRVLQAVRDGGAGPHRG